MLASLSEPVFGLANLWVLPFWALMIFLPGWGGTRRLMAGVWPVAVLAVAYAGLLLAQVGAPGGADLLAGLASPSAAGIAVLLGNPAGAAIGWIHFLAFDLFVGRWAYLDSRERQMPVWLASPALGFIFLAGPLGFLLYLLARTSRRPAAMTQS